ncbi:MAG: DUF502 domain-containing protein [Gammaproteobacteria bacterium]
MRTLRKYLIAGLLVWLPLAATVVIIKLVIDLLDQTILLIPPEWRPETVIGISIPFFGVIVGLFILLITGIFAANMFGKRLVSLWESILGRIPLVRTIYTSVKQVLETLFTSNSKSFRKVVLVEYPRTGIWSLGFLTNDGLAAAKSVSGHDLVSIFVPTTPNPTSGFIVMFPKDDVTELELSVEDGFKFIISMGVIVPNDSVKDSLVKGELAQTTADS